MPGARVNPKSDDAHLGNVTKFVKENFKKIECNRFRLKRTTDDIEFCQCGYTLGVHSDKAIQNKLRESEPSTETFKTDAFGYLPYTEETENDSDWKTELKKIPYIRLEYKTETDLIWKLFLKWKVVEPDVIFSVISSPVENDGSVESIRKKICCSIVEAAASTNAWIITGGLNKGIDQLIGDEVKQRRNEKKKIPKAVIGISNWGCLAEKEKFLNKSSGSKYYASDKNPTGLSLNLHHTHFLLVDDGRQNELGCECVLRKPFEFFLTKKEANVGEYYPRKPLIYILIGGSNNAYGVVYRSLIDRIPVIIATGTGGAADEISKIIARDYEQSECLPEIFDKRLQDLLTTAGASEIQARKVIANINTKTNLKSFFGIVELLRKETVSDGGTQQLRDETTSDAANLTHGLFERMLLENGISQDITKRTVSDIEHEVMKETLTKIIRNDLLIEFDIRKEKKIITSFIIEALKKGNLDKPCDVYMLAANWNNDKFFKQLLWEKGMTQVHETVLMELLNKGNHKYFRLMMEHIVGRNWMPMTHGPLEADLKRTIPCEKMLKEISDQAGGKTTEDERHKKTGKMCFLWCVHKQMREAAMSFWKQGQDCLAMALLAYSESKKLKKELTDKEGYDKIEQLMEHFSKHSIDLLKSLYANSHRNTHDLLVGEVKDLTGLTPLQIAVDANFTKFISETPVQKLLDKIWINNIEHPSKYRYLPMVLSGACPLLAPALLAFQDDSSNEEDDCTTTQQNKFKGSYWWTVKAFIDTPLVKFTYGFISYIGYLILFSIVMLTDFRPTMSPSEIALNIWTLILFIEEVRQINVEKRRYKNQWHYFDIAVLTIYIIGFMLRMIYLGDPAICPACLYVARIILAFSLMIFFLRTLQFLSICESLGSRIYMIRRLLAVLVHYMVILTVFISAYGVVSNVILYPNQPLNGKLLQDVFYDAWWSLVLWFNLDDALGLNCNTDNPSRNISAEYCSSQTDPSVNYVECKQKRCPANTWIVSVLLAFYVLLTVIMMLNVLIDLFTHPFSTVNERQKEVSKMQRYRIIREYSSRSMIPPPLCVITYPYHIARYFYKLCKDCSKVEDDSPKGNVKVDVEEEQGESKQKLCSGQPKEFAKILDSTVKDWEHREVDEYDGRILEEERLVAQLKFEKDQTDNFHKTLMGKYIIEQIRIQMAELQSTAEATVGPSRPRNENLSRDDQRHHSES